MMILMTYSIPCSLSHPSPLVSVACSRHRPLEVLTSTQDATGSYPNGPALEPAVTNNRNVHFTRSLVSQLHCYIYSALILCIVDNASCIHPFIIRDSRRSTLDFYPPLDDWQNP